jgi:hypothetical protein
VDASSVIWRVPDCAPERSLSRFDERKQQQHQSDEEGDVHELARVVYADDTDQPGNQQSTRNLEQHFASGSQRTLPEADVQLRDDRGGEITRPFDDVCRWWDVGAVRSTALCG